MKRRLTSTSSPQGFQTISKFFKTTERQDVHDAARLKENPQVIASKSKANLVGPVLQKLTKLREVLTKKKIPCENSVCCDDKKDENMNNNRFDDQSNNGNSKNGSLFSRISGEDFTSLNTDDSALRRNVTEDNLISTGVSSFGVTNVRGVQSPNFNLEVEENSFNNSLNKKGRELQSESSFSKGEVCDSQPMHKQCKINNNTMDTNAMDCQESSDQQDTDLHEHSERISTGIISGNSFQKLEDDQIADDSERSLLNRNTEENLADDEDEGDDACCMSDESDSESPIGHRRSQVSNKLSKVGTNDKDVAGNDDISSQGKITLESDRLSTQKDVAPEDLWDSQSSQENFNKGESESDDELLTPPSFLYENKLEKVLCTPEKIATPSGASPLCSPVKPARDMKKELDTGNYRFSLQKMVSKSKKKEAANAKISQMVADLDAGIKKGGVKIMTSVLSEDDTDTDRDDGKDLSLCKLPKEVAKHLGKVSNFSEELVGEDIFPDFHNIVEENELPFLNITSPKEDDTFVQHLMTCKASDLKEVICGGWFMQYYLKRPCPPTLAEWVFTIMCTYPDVYLSSHCFKTLWALLRAGYQDQNGIPKGIRGITTWVPSISSIINILQHFGATPETIVPEGSNIADSMFKRDSTEQDQINQHDMKNSNDSSGCQLCSFIRQLVQLVTHAIHFGNYVENDLPLLLVIVCRLSLDVRLQELLFDLETCVSEILNCFGIAQWEEQIKSLPPLLVLASTNHRNLLHIMQVLPPSPRGSQLRQLTCVVLIKFFVKELTCGKEVTDVEERTQALQELCKTVEFDINELSSIIQGIKPRKIPDCNNYLLHTIISLVDLAIGSEEYPSSDRNKLKMLGNKLNNLNSEIKDPRAKFLDRTKVKDMIVRTVHRISCLVDSIKPPKERELTEYFEVNSTDYTIQPLEETSTVTNNDQENGSDSSEVDEGSSPIPVFDIDDIEENQN